MSSKFIGRAVLVPSERSIAKLKVKADDAREQLQAYLRGMDRVRKESGVTSALIEGEESYRRDFRKWQKKHDEAVRNLQLYRDLADDPNYRDRLFIERKRG